MSIAIEEAKAAMARKEVPVGCVIVDSHSGAIVAQTGNRTEADRDPCAHAEILAIRTAAQVMGTARLSSCDLYVTLEPCTMCAGAIAHARLRRLYFGAYDPKGGGVDHGARFFSQPTCHHRPDVYGGLQEQVCQNLLQDFFRNLR